MELTSKEQVVKVYPDAYSVYSIDESSWVIRATEGRTKFARISPFPSTAGTPEAAWDDAASRLPVAPPSTEWWNETEAAKLCDAAQLALYEVHRYMEQVLKREDWREVYGFRVKLGGIEDRLRYIWDKERTAKIESEELDEN